MDEEPLWLSMSGRPTVMIITCIFQIPESPVNIRQTDRSREVNRPRRNLHPSPIYQLPTLWTPNPGCRIT